jgi:hypothetical protein
LGQAIEVMGSHIIGYKEDYIGLYRTKNRNQKNIDRKGE